MNKKELGSVGENLAAEFLVIKGFVILGRNVRSRIGEIDILCRDGEVIVIIEVKTQISARFSDPVFKVGPAKQRKLRQLARLVAAKSPGTNVRIDVVTVTLEPRVNITYLENVLE